MHKFIIYDFIFCRDDIDAANIASWKFSYKQAEVEEGVKSVGVCWWMGVYTKAVALAAILDASLSANKFKP